MSPLKLRKMNLVELENWPAMLYEISCDELHRTYITELLD